MWIFSQNVRNCVKKVPNWMEICEREVFNKNFSTYLILLGLRKIDLRNHEGGQGSGIEKRSLKPILVENSGIFPISHKKILTFVINRCKMKWGIMGKSGEMNRFRGLYTGTLDQKGRLNLPAKFRKLFSPDDNDTVILLKGSSNNILVYPLKVWEQVEDELLERKKNSPHYAAVIRQLNALLDEQHLDAQGRITIPQRLKEKAKINKEVYIVGNLTHMEIWDIHEFDQTVDDAPDMIQILRDELGL